MHLLEAKPGINSKGTPLSSAVSDVGKQPAEARHRPSEGILQGRGPMSVRAAASPREHVKVYIPLLSMMHILLHRSRPTGCCWEMAVPSEEASLCALETGMASALN